MKRWIVMGLVVAVLAAGAAGLFLRAKGIELVVTNEQIEEKLGEKFPIEESYLLADIVLSAPKVAVIEGSDRIAVSMEAQLEPKLPPGTKPIDGRCEITTGLEYDSADQEFYLRELKFERLDIGEVPAALTNGLKRLVEKAALSYLDRYPVYELKGDDAKGMAAQAVLKNVEARDGALVITLGL